MIAALLLLASQGTLLEGMEDPARFRLPKEKAALEAVTGRTGKALRFRIDEGAQNAFFMSRVRGTPEWDDAAGLSFWVKGDGSPHLGAIQLIWNEDYALRYDAAFPIDGREWRKISIPWRDFIPVMPAKGAVPLDPRKGNAPSRISALWFGKWWYWKDKPAHAFALDDLALEPKIDLPPDPPAGRGLARVAARVKAGKLVSIVTMGDSLTDVRHWTNRKTNWPAFLRERLKKESGSEAMIINPAIGGSQLRQNLILLPTWTAETPQPDLVTVFFAYNDWSSGMRGPMFRDTLCDAVDRIRRATGGKADILLLTACPAVERWTEMGELAEAARAVAKEKGVGLADVEKAFHGAGKEDRAALFCRDKVHLSEAGQRLIAETVLRALR